VVLTGRPDSGLPSAAEQAVIWHDLECGGYDADLQLWRRLAASDKGSSDGPILEVGAGSAGSLSISRPPVAR